MKINPDNLDLELVKLYLDQLTSDIPSDIVNKYRLNSRIANSLYAIQKDALNKGYRIGTKTQTQLGDG